MSSNARGRGEVRFDSRRSTETIAEYAACQVQERQGDHLELQRVSRRDHTHRAQRRRASFRPASWAKMRKKLGATRRRLRKRKALVAILARRIASHVKAEEEKETAGTGGRTARAVLTGRRASRTVPASRRARRRKAPTGAGGAAGAERKAREAEAKRRRERNAEAKRRQEQEEQRAGRYAEISLEGRSGSH